jgi:hypothetical protein
MLVTVPDSGLNELLASPELLSQTWPGADQEVMTLVQVLRIAEPSLEEALAVGLVKLLTPATGKASANIGLTHRRTVLTGIARRRDSHSRVLSPHARLGEVTWVEVRDFAVEGRSGLRLTG